MGLSASWVMAQEAPAQAPTLKQVREVVQCIIETWTQVERKDPPTTLEREANYTQWVKHLWDTRMLAYSIFEKWDKINGTYISRNDGNLIEWLEAINGFSNDPTLDILDRLDFERRDTDFKGVNSLGWILCDRDTDCRIDPSYPLTGRVSWSISSKLDISTQQDIMNQHIFEALQYCGPTS